MSGAWLFNPGSSSLKWAWFGGPGDAAPVEEGKAGGRGLRRRLRELLAARPAALAVVRFVHGGSDFVHPLSVDASVLARLQELAALAPLHNRQGLECLELLLEECPALPAVAVFDTEFFHDLPQAACLYGLPRALIRRHRLRRFGFHGFAHAGMARRWREARGAEGGGEARLVTVQLGSGCSMAALHGGCPIDTTMGFTPNEGLLMSTRCGDLDPGLLTWLQRREGWTPEETDRILNEESGWLGLSGESADFALLLASGSAEAREAVELLAHRVRKTLGGYHALLGGLDGVVLGGGIAEGAPAYCRRLLAGLEHLGIELNEEVSQGPDAERPFVRLSAADSPALCGVAANDEYRSMLASVKAGLPEIIQ